MEKWLKRIWFINGILIFFWGSAFLIGQIQRYFPIRRLVTKQGPIVGEKLSKAIQDTIAIQNISLSLPLPVGSSKYKFISLRSKDLTTPIRSSNFLEPQLATVSMIRRGEPDFSQEYNILEGMGTINIIFVKSDGSEAHLLLSKKGYIATADIPNEQNTTQNFILYRIVFDDTDNDGRLTYYDKSNLYISNLAGKELRQISDDRYGIIRYLKLFKDNKLILHIKVRPEDKKINPVDWPEKVVSYDLKSGKLTAFLGNDSLLIKARNMLWNK